jgi:hypothetical protein
MWMRTSIHTESCGSRLVRPIRANDAIGGAILSPCRPFFRSASARATEGWKCSTSAAEAARLVEVSRWLTTCDPDHVCVMVSQLAALLRTAVLEERPAALGGPTHSQKRAAEQDLKSKPGGPLQANHLARRAGQNASYFHRVSRRMCCAHVIQLMQQRERSLTRTVYQSQSALRCRPAGQSCPCKVPHHDLGISPDAWRSRQGSPTAPQAARSVLEQSRP